MKKLQIMLVIFVVVFTNFGGSAFADNLGASATNEASTATTSAPKTSPVEQIETESVPTSQTIAIAAEPTTTTDDAPDTDTNDETEPSDNTPAVINPLQIARVAPTGNTESLFVQIGNFSDKDIPINSLEVKLFNTKDASLAPLTKPYILPTGSGTFLKKSFVMLGVGDDFHDFANNPTKSTTLPPSAGAVQLFVDGELADQVCWGKSTICGGGTNNISLSTLANKALENTLLAGSATMPEARFNIIDRLDIPAAIDLESGGFVLDASDGDASGASGSQNNPSDDDTTLQNPDCQIAKLNEIGANLDAQFIEIVNPTDRDLNLSGCQIMTNRSSSKKYVFGDEILPASSVLSVEITNTNLTLTKTTTGKVYFGDAITDYDEVDYANLPSKTSFAKFDNDWKTTYAPTPNATNAYQQYPACDDGYFRNLTTGRCDKLATTSETVKLCAADQFLNPETNRCKKIATTAALTPCAAGSSRNPETNRCKKDTVATSTACPAGSSRNPETNRCRKDVASSSAQYPVKTAAIKASEAWKLVALAVVAGTGLIVVWQFREEIGATMAKFRARFQQKEAAQ